MAQSYQPDLSTVQQAHPPQPVEIFGSRNPASSGDIVVTILSPSHLAKVPWSDLVSLRASATDGSDNISHKVRWSSSKDGDLGQGELVQKSLTAGTHVITAKVTRMESPFELGSGNVTVVEATVTVNVDPVPYPYTTYRAAKKRKSGLKAFTGILRRALRKKS